MNVVISAEQEQMVSDEALAVADRLGKLIETQELPLVLLGPAPCPLIRIKARRRWLVKSPVDEIGRVVRYAAPRLEGRGTCEWCWTGTR